MEPQTKGREVPKGSHEPETPVTTSLQVASKSLWTRDADTWEKIKPGAEELENMNIAMGCSYKDDIQRKMWQRHRIGD